MKYLQRMASNIIDYILARDLKRNRQAAVTQHAKIIAESKSAYQVLYLLESLE